MRVLRARFLGLVDYETAFRIQLAAHEAVESGRDENTLLLLEHPPVYTLGRRGGGEFLLLSQGDVERLGARVIQSDRGGLITFHGPGQLVGYPIINLGYLRHSLSWYIQQLLEGVAESLVGLGLRAQADLKLRPGVYVGNRKLAAVGVRKKGNTTYHGFAVNISPEMHWFEQMVGCGLEGVRATSVLQELGSAPTLEGFGLELARNIARRLGLRLEVE